MKGNIKLGLALIVAMVFVNSTVAFANTDSTVTATKDNITITKSAQWTEYNGSKTDDKGNPYAKISFKIDASKAETTITNVVSKGGDTDVMLVFDMSSSMKPAARIEAARKAAKEFTEEVMKNTPSKVKVGLVTFDKTAKVDINLSNDKAAILAKIDAIKTGYYTNVEDGILKARECLKNSTAQNKLIVLLGDGRPNTINENNKTEYVGREKAATAAIEQSKLAQKEINGLKIVTIGFETDQVTESILKEIATNNANGQKMFYKADIKASALVQDLASVFKTITEKVESYVVGNSLIDIIPDEFNVVDGTIKVNDKNVTVFSSGDRKTITWSWGNNKLENKVYEMSLITTLDKSKVPDSYFTDKKDVFTNGTTIDTSKDSTGSSKFGYGQVGVIKLTSPKLPLTDIVEETKNDSEKVNVNPNDNLNPDDKDNSKLDDSPKTGSNFNQLIFLVLVISGGIVTSGIMFVKRRH